MNFLNFYDTAMTSLTLVIPLSIPCGSILFTTSRNDFFVLQSLQPRASCDEMTHADWRG